MSERPEACAERVATRRISFRVNGENRTVEAPPLARLLDVLREDLKLTGPKEGCGEGLCGACTVLLDGRAVNACRVPVLRAEGREVLTVEGLGDRHGLDALQASFHEHGAVRCGFCSPGMLVAAADLLARDPEPGDEEVREHLKGHRCRCTGYGRIVEAVREGGEA